MKLYTAEGPFVLGQEEPDGSRPTRFTAHGIAAEEHAATLATLLNAIAEFAEDDDSTTEAERYEPRPSDDPFLRPTIPLPEQPKPA